MPESIFRPRSPPACLLGGFRRAIFGCSGQRRRPRLSIQPEGSNQGMRFRIGGGVFSRLKEGVFLRPRAHQLFPIAAIEATVGAMH